MSGPKNTPKNKQLKAQIMKELNFLKGVFSVLSLPSQATDKLEDADFEIVNENPKNDDEQEPPKRARSIAELEEKLEKIKSRNNFNLKNKLVKKSLSSKLNKTLKKKERLKTKMKLPKQIATEKDSEPEKKPQVNNAKPIFNTDGKLVFSKFDFSNLGHKEKMQKGGRDPKKILENLQQQEQKLQQIKEQDQSKVKEIKEKMAWKNILQKAEGQKVKDDPNLLKKSIKKMEQKKKHSKKQWDTRVQNVQQKKEDRQKKRTENISKKKKEKKSKIVKTAVKRGRVVI